MPGPGEHVSFTVMEVGTRTLLSTGQEFPEMATIAGWSESDPHHPVVGLRLLVEDGAPIIDSITVYRRSPGDKEIDGSILRAIRVKDLREGAIAAVMGEYFVWRTGTRLEAGRQLAGAPNWQERLVARVPRRRRLIDRSLLERVAEIYNADTSGAPTKAVATHFNTHHRNATRYVALARREGLLPPYGGTQEVQQ